MIIIIINGLWKGIMLTSHLLIRDIHDYFDHFSQLVHGHVQNNDWEQHFFLPSHIGNGTVDIIASRG